MPWHVLLPFAVHELNDMPGRLHLLVGEPLAKLVRVDDRPLLTAASASDCGAGGSRPVRRARTPPIPAGGGPVPRSCRATDFAPTHRQCTPSRSSRRTDDRTVGPCGGALRRGSTDTIPRYC